MNLTKQQKMGAVGGGVFALGVIVLGYLVFSAWSNLSDVEDQGREAEGGGEEGEAQVEEIYGLNKEQADFDAYIAENPFPNAVSLATAKSNSLAYASWSSNALDFVSRADKTYETESSDGLKEMIKNAVAKMAQLKNGTIAEKDFKFGFDAWYGKNEDSDAVRARLMRQLDTVTSVVDLLDQAGVLEIKGIELVEPKVAEPQPSGGKSGKKGPEPKFKDDVLEYGFVVTTRPAGLVGLLNAFVKDECFYEVKDLKFNQMFDRIDDNIRHRVEAREKAEQGKAAAGEGRGGRRRRGAQAVEEPKKQDSEAAAVLSRVVTDLESDADKIEVSFTLAVHDFGRGAVNAEAAKAETSEQGNSDVKKEGN